MSVRVGALLADLVFFGIFVVVMSVIMHTPGLQTAPDGTIQYQALADFIDVCCWLSVLLYVPVCWYVFGGTVGQRLLGLRVARASDGKPLGVGRVALRYLVWATCLCLIVPAVIAAAVAAGDPQKRAWTDFAGDSVVVARS